MHIVHSLKRGEMNVTTKENSMKILGFLGVYFLTFSLTEATASPTVSLPTHGVSHQGFLKYPPNFTHFAYTNPNAPKGGEAKFATVGTFDNFNFVSLKGDLAAGASTFPHCTLLATSEDELTAMYGYLAEKIEVAQDHKSVTFTLNKNAVFSDGTPVTAEDVIFSFDTLKKVNPMFSQYYKDVTHAKKLSLLKVHFLFRAKLTIMPIE